MKSVNMTWGTGSFQKKAQLRTARTQEWRSEYFVAALHMRRLYIASTSKERVPVQGRNVPVARELFRGSEDKICKQVILFIHRIYQQSATTGKEGTCFTFPLQSQ
ncbi:uncharacterized protein LOC135154559 [Lytechinus pictus]|uniref:uncharacterized protein LOC135154559 n=1 Tax=Lytechinus pictus TaxID=7653 RepID=UPI0030B9CE41